MTEPGGEATLVESWWDDDVRRRRFAMSPRPAWARVPAVFVEDPAQSAAAWIVWMIDLNQTSPPSRSSR